MNTRLSDFISERKYDIIGICLILIAFAITAFAFVQYSKGMYYYYHYDYDEELYRLTEGYTNFNFMEIVGAVYLIACTIIIAYCRFYGSWNIRKVFVWGLLSFVLLFIASTMVEEIVNFHSRWSDNAIQSLSPLTVVACAYAYALPFIIGAGIVTYMLRIGIKPVYIAIVIAATIVFGYSTALIYNFCTYLFALAHLSN